MNVIQKDRFEHDILRLGKVQEVARYLVLFGFEILDCHLIRFFLIVNLNKLNVVCQNKSWLRSPLLNRHVFC
jgi:hypothetical protein